MIFSQLYHEATLVNLLETVLFHKESWQSAEENALDLLDYCYRKLVSIVGKCDSSSITTDDESNINSMEVRIFFLFSSNLKAI